VNCEIKDGNFWLNGRKVFLNSGEIHYFRIRRELWDKHLKAACEAGLSAVSTYVPWAWHEAEEGTFDLDGISCAERDLKGWLRRCQTHGLTCIIKPGPFVLAETRGSGLPDWFLSQHRQAVKMRNRKGEIVSSEGVCLFHPIFLEKATRWYDQIMPLIRQHETSSGGPIILMQICNEIGLYSWLAHQAEHAIEEISLADTDVLFVENVGNLVCPAEFDLGESARVMVLGVTEGADKPLKYPLMFRRCAVLVLNKMDLADRCGCDIGELKSNALKVNPDIRIMELSCLTGEGLEEWIKWLCEEAGKKVDA